MGKRKKTAKAKKASLNKKTIIAAIRAVFSENMRMPLNYKQIASMLLVNDAETKKLINSCLLEMAKNDELEETERGRFRLKVRDAYIVGRVDLTATGSAYIVAEGIDKDVFVSNKNLNKALHDDIVKVYVYAQRRRNHVEGEVVEIIQRKREHFVGKLEVARNYAFLIPERRQMPVDIFIPLDKLNHGKNGEKAIVKIIDWPDGQKSPIGEVVEILGLPGENEVEMHAILAEFGLPYQFPDKVLEAAERITELITDEERSHRRDFRNITTFTIDPVDAKDFDDALSYRKLENGNIEVGVHIADVTHYVLPNTVLDKEAAERATSVYLVDRVVPMLPEKLSNLVCSLRPNEEKLTFSAVFEMDNEANVINQWFGKTVILSDRRFTYEEAQEVIETGEGDLKEEILTLNNLAMELRKQRFRNGSINFDRSEVKFQLDEKANPIGVYLKENKDSNKLVEEFMLLANKKVAEFIGKVKEGASAKTFVYRIHDEPNLEKLNALSYFIRRFGYRLQTKNRQKLAESINGLLADVKGKNEQTLVESIAIRTMAKAEYTTKNVGHYGLAFPFYTHFTSPIRRYPDMMVHRLLELYLNGAKNQNQDKYEELCKHSSEMEQLAATAERASIKYKQVEFMKDNIGKVFRGIISGVTQWGFYVELNDTKCEGMVSIRSLNDDFYEYDEAEFAIIGSSTMRRFTLGDEVEIRVANANLERKQLDFELVAQVRKD